MKEGVFLRASFFELLLIKSFTFLLQLLSHNHLTFPLQLLSHNHLTFPLQLLSHNHLTPLPQLLPHHNLLHTIPSDPAQRHFERAARVRVTREGFKRGVQTRHIALEEGEAADSAGGVGAARGRLEGEGGVGAHHRHLERVAVEQHPRSHAVNAAEEDRPMQETGRERGVGEKKDGGVEETYIGREDLSDRSGEGTKREGFFVAREEGNGRGE